MNKITSKRAVNQRLNFNWNGRRHQMKLTSFTVKDRAIIKNRVRELVSARHSSAPLEPKLIDWLNNLPDSLHGRLVGIGLADTRCEFGVSGFFESYIAERLPKMSKSWKLNQQATLRKLKEYFDGVLLLDLTPSMAQAFRDDLAEKQAQATVSGHIKRIKTALGFAVKRGLVHSSAFNEVVAGNQSNEGRKHFVSCEVIEKVIDACPNAEWRLLVALARFGGLRNPSETMALEWKDVDFVNETINVPGSKGKNGEIRWRTIPIYPELLEPLREAFNPTHIKCVEIAGTCAWRRKKFKQIIKLAGVDAWPRIWHNLRATRDTELSAELPAHEVARLMGNSVKVSEEHYKMINPANFDSLKASRHKNDTCDTKTTQKPPVTNDTEGNGLTFAQEKTEVSGKPRRFVNNTSTPERTRTNSSSAANSVRNSTGRLARHNTDTQINELIECWGGLDDKARVDLLNYAAGLTSPLQLIAGFHQQSKEEG